MKKDKLKQDDFLNYNDFVKTFGENYKKLNTYVMKHTLSLCESNPTLKSSIQQTIDNQYIVYENDQVVATEDGPTTNIIISTKRTMEAAEKYRGKKVGILNFANNHSVGGAPFTAGAQEESMCRISTLYPCLTEEKPNFYNRHIEDYENGLLTNLGCDDLIYSPDIVVFKTDESAPVLLDESRFFKVNIITSAAPELRRSAGKVDLTALEKIIFNRLKKVVEVAKKEGIDVFILGAWGCGAFRNPPEIVARVFKELLTMYKFDTVEFAIFCRDFDDPNNNYNVFKKAFEN